MGVGQGLDRVITALERQTAQSYRVESYASGASHNLIQNGLLK